MKKLNNITNLIDWIKNPIYLEDLLLLHNVSKSEFEMVCDQIISHFDVQYCQHGYLGNVVTRFRIGEFPKVDLSLHTDGFYHNHIPDFAILYCIEPGPFHISTEFVRTPDLLAMIDKNTINILSSLDLEFIANDRRKYSQPLIELYNGKHVLNWVNTGNFKINLEKTVKGIPTTNEVINSLGMLHSQMKSYSKSIKHMWSKGDLVLWNNREYIHGRQIYDIDTYTVEEGERILKRIYFKSNF